MMNNFLFTSNPFNTLLDLLFPKFNKNYSSFREYLTKIEIDSFSPFKKDSLSLENKFLVPEVWACGDYRDQLLQDLILRAKIYGETAISKDLSNLIYTHSGADLQNIDYISFVPADPFRFLKRGYHLPAKIAEELSKKIKRPYISTLYKPKTTKTQISLTKKERLNNLKNCFVLDPDLELDLDFQTVLILDDVCTTGSTLAEASRVLKREFPAVNLRYQVIAG